jgi:5-methylcytosine-specific restriction endonuclease McrA
LKIHDPRYPTFDHVIPRSRGGRTVLTNGLLKHQECNAKRGNENPTGCDLIWVEFVRARLAVRPRSVKGAPGWYP